MKVRGERKMALSIYPLTPTLSPRDWGRGGMWLCCGAKEIIVANIPYNLEVRPDAFPMDLACSLLQILRINLDRIVFFQFICIIFNRFSDFISKNFLGNVLPYTLEGPWRPRQQVIYV